MELVKLFEQLEHIEGDCETYSAKKLNPGGIIRIARDGDGRPTLLFTMSENDLKDVPIRLPNLEYLPHCEILVTEGSASHSEKVSLVKCVSEDFHLQLYFLRLMSTILSDLGDNPNGFEISQAVKKIAELFRALDSPSMTSLQGIWCELFLILKSNKIRQSVMAWHPSPSSLHDFVAGQQRIEVKSCTGPHRIHHFSLEQLTTSPTKHLIVVSFHLRNDGNGSSIEQLWSEISSSPYLSTNQLQRLETILVLALGRDWKMADRIRFDTEQAWNSIRIYSSNIIPRVNDCVPGAVTKVNFCSELTDLESMSKTQVCKQGSLFNAVFGTE